MGINEGMGYWGAVRVCGDWWGVDVWGPDGGMCPVAVACDVLFFLIRSREVDGRR